jgi:hypothetical protein
MNMHTLNRRAFVASCAALPFSGCALFNQNLTEEEKIAMAVRLAKSASYIGTSAYLNGHPDTGTLLAFHAAVGAIDVLIDNSDANLQKLHDILAKLPDGKLTGTDGEIYWLIGVQVIDLAGVGFDVQSKPAVLAVATAIRDGISLAIESRPITKALEARPAKPAKPEKPPRVRIIPI